jgi:transcriptional regulator with XRE-family HTH domain
LNPPTDAELTAEEDAFEAFVDGVRRTMEETGTTQAELARRLGANASEVWKVLHGRRSDGSRSRPTLRMMARMALALGRSLKISID